MILLIKTLAQKQCDRILCLKLNKKTNERGVMYGACGAALHRHKTEGKTHTKDLFVRIARRREMTEKMMKAPVTDKHKMATKDSGLKLMTYGLNGGGPTYANVCNKSI